MNQRDNNKQNKQLPRQKNDTHPHHRSDAGAESKQPSAGASIRVGICDASATVRTGLGAIFETTPDIKVEMVVATQDEVTAKLAGTDIDVLMVDIDDWDHDGDVPALEYLGKLLEAKPNIKVALFTNCHVGDKVTGAIECGVQGRPVALRDRGPAEQPAGEAAQVAGQFEHARARSAGTGRQG